MHLEEPDFLKNQSINKNPFDFCSAFLFDPGIHIPSQIIFLNILKPMELVFCEIYRKMLIWMFAAGKEKCLTSTFYYEIIRQKNTIDDLAKENTCPHIQRS